VRPTAETSRVINLIPPPAANPQPRALADVVESRDEGRGAADDWHGDPRGQGARPWAQERERMYGDGVATAPGFGEWPRMSARHIPAAALELIG
jgi:hypothetical protein